MKNYFQSTRTATYGFLTAIPLLLAYELLIIAVNPRHDMQIRVGADVWIKQVLAAMGATGQHALVAITFSVGLIIFFHERKKNIIVKASYFSLLVVESLFYSVLLAAIISNTVGYLFQNLYSVTLLQLQANPFAQGKNFWLQIALSIGAGIYEELFFRVLLISLLYFVFRHFTIGARVTAYILAALVAALLFSAVHYIGPFGDGFTIQSFTFRFLFGLAFNILYVLRGFGVVAWSHALYDILLTAKLMV